MYDVNPRQVDARFLSESELIEVHYASLEILERTGALVQHPEVLDRLHGAGSKVGPGDRVRVPSSLVKRALETAPERVVLADTLGTRRLRLERNKVYFGTGSDLKYTLDHRTGQHQLSTLADVRQAALVCDALPNMDFVMSYGLASDVPAPQQELFHFIEMLKHTTKPMLLTTFGDARVLKDIYTASCIVAGGEREFKAAPFFALYGQFVSPLVHNRDSLDRLVFCAKRDIPVIYIPTILGGASGPVTMAGSLALGNAEVLLGLTIHQLINPGAPFIYGGCICPFDMRDATIVYGAPEWHMASSVLSQLSMLYKLPMFSTGGCSDSKVLDEQAAIEATFSIMLGALSGANLVHDVGYLGNGLIGSLPYLVVCDEIISMARRMLRGFNVSSETLALDVIDRVGPGGHFIQDEHTLRHFKEEVWYPNLFDRRPFDSWAGQPGMTLAEKAVMRVEDILAGHEPRQLEAGKWVEIEELTGMKGLGHAVA